eukprot:gb/GEZN01011181.1/.p1 GENE.gb/GEZN01011181.1/~~gb/GEZN01011181.1/.p1  ORF type:complete len:317 (+),score=24.12 gb/GEZN01011181.1/:117-1067(+)
MGISLGTRPVVLFLLALLVVRSVGGGWTDKSIEKPTKAKCRVFFPTLAIKSSCVVFVIAVGTGMRSDGYNRLGTKLCESGHVMAVVDPNPGSMVKLDSLRFRNAFEAARQNMDAWMLNATNSSKCPGKNWKYVVGGHSAGGQAAANSLAISTEGVNGFLGLDPYNCKSVTSKAKTALQKLPGAVWGLKRTTCAVTSDLAASRCYRDIASGSTMEGLHALFHVDNSALTCPTYNHCGFSDTGCDGGQSLIDICQIRCPRSAVDLTDAVAASADRLADRVHTVDKKWSKADWTLKSSVPLVVTVSGRVPQSRGQGSHK